MYVIAKSDSLLVTGDYSDLSLVSGSRRYKAHRSVICPRSPVIAKACVYNNINEERKLRSSDSDGNDTIPLFPLTSWMMIRSLSIVWFSSCIDWTTPLSFASPANTLNQK